MILNCWGLFFLLGVYLFVSAVFFRILFYRMNIEDAETFYYYSFNSFWRTFETLLISMMLGNYPYLILDVYKHGIVYPIFLYVFNLFAIIFLYGFFAGGMGDEFINLYKVTLRKIASEYSKA